MTFEDSIHKVTLSGSEISSILYALEGWIQANDEYNEGGDLSLDIDNVFTALEEVADSWEGEFADPKVLDREDIVVASNAMQIAADIGRHDFAVQAGKIFYYNNVILDTKSFPIVDRPEFGKIMFPDQS